MGFVEMNVATNTKKTVELLQLLIAEQRKTNELLAAMNAKSPALDPKV